MVARKQLIIILISLLALAACQASETATPRGGIVPTRIATGTATTTPTATATFTPSNTPTPSDTPTPTATPTLAIPTIEIGEAFNFSANGTLTVTDWRLRYHFVAEVGDSISIQMTTNSPRLDPLLVLENEAGERLAINDDAIEGSDNAAILNYVIESNGTYTILATRRGEEDSPYIGDFQLSFLRLSASYYDPNSGISLLPIESNSNNTGVISNEAFYTAYIFNGTAGQVVTIEMSRASGNLDAYLILLNRRTRNILLENDDDSRSETTNAYIAEITLPEDGEYIILATRYQGVDGTSVGEFALTLTSTPNE